MSKLMTTLENRLRELADRVEYEAANLPDFRKNEAMALALTDEEQEEMKLLRLLVAAPEMKSALQGLVGGLRETGTTVQLSTREFEDARFLLSELEW